jgi:hypothetical protein
MGEDLLDHLAPQDGGDALDLHDAAVGAVLHVDVEHLLAQPIPTDAAGLRRESLDFALARDCSCGGRCCAGGSCGTTTGRSFAFGARTS